MVKHIVFFKLKEDLVNKQEITSYVINKLLELKDKISQIKFYELGTNFANRDTAFDIALVSHFENRKDLDIYRNHSEHIKAINDIKKYISKTAVVDYEI